MKGIAIAFAALLTFVPGTALATSSRSQTASKSFTYRGGGWTLTLHPTKAWYGSTLAGSMTYGGKTYHVEGDWIPAGDAGGDLLRFFGHPFPGQPQYGLVSVATLYDSCIPNCAASRLYDLNAISQWTLPGSKARSVRMTVRA